MRKTVTLLLAVCLLLACPTTCLAVGGTQEATAGSAEITTEVPSTHLLTVEAEHAAVSYNGVTGDSIAVPRLETFTLTVTPADGYAISGVTLNGEDVTASLSGTTLTISGIYADGVLSVSTVEIPEGESFSGVLYDLPEQDFPDNGLLYKIAVEVGGLTKVPEAFQNNPKLNTVEKITQVLTTILIGQCGYPEENVAVYEVTLVVSGDNGATWEVAEEEHFPTSGLTVILPYPEGTGRDTDDFAVTHMFTSTAFGKTPGDTENPAATKTSTGLQMTLTGLSPVAIAWNEIGSETASSTTTTTTDTGTSDENPKTGDSANLALWFALLAVSCGGLLLAACLGRKKH